SRPLRWGATTSPAAARQPRRAVYAFRALRLMDRDAVAAAVLRLVERLVGPGDQVGGVLDGRVGQGGDADADGDGDGRPLVDERVVLARRAHALADDLRLRHVGAAADDGELLAAVAGEDVLGAQRRRQQRGDLRQHQVAGLVAVGVVHLLEVVD